MSEDNNSTQSAQSLLNELFAHCESGSLSEEGLREIIERRHGLTPDHNPHISDFKFFFAACRNERINEGIIRYLLEYFPAAATANDLYNGWSPLHIVCRDPNADPCAILRVVQRLIDAAPDSVRHVDNGGWMPLHLLCNHRKVDDAAAIEILKLLIEKHPAALRQATHNGVLPIHFAASQSRSPEFCQLLIDAYPGSEQIADAGGMLPLHYACLQGTVATLEYMYKLYPDATNHATTAGFYPIHIAILSLRLRNKPGAAVDIVQFLLDCDPNVKLQMQQERVSLLLFACVGGDYNDSNIEAALGVIKIIYDAHPEAIEDNEIAIDIDGFHQQVHTFINSQLVYSRQAKDHHLMTTPDEKGQLPLHTALQNNIRLGSIKLLVKGNPSAIRTLDNNFALPLHLACQYHDSAFVIQYLLGLDMRTLRAVDDADNTALHYACRGAKYDTIALLLEKYDAVSVSQRNTHKKLPIDLLWESNVVVDRESIEYTESVFRLLRAYPETIMKCIM